MLAIRFSSHQECWMNMCLLTYVVVVQCTGAMVLPRQDKETYSPTKQHNASCMPTLIKASVWEIKRQIHRHNSSFKMATPTALSYKYVMNYYPFLYKAARKPCKQIYLRLLQMDWSRYVLRLKHANCKMLKVYITC